MKLITRSDFDGLVCAVLLKELGLADSIEFAHPKDVQDGKIPVTSDHILTNLPYVDGVGLWFDHHSSESERAAPKGFKGSFVVAPSAARVVFDYYNDPRLNRFKDLITVVDKSDSAQLDEDDLINPTGWILLSYIMDPRTGLGRYHDYEVSNRQLMMEMVDLIRKHSADEILALPQVKVRVGRYLEGQEQFEKIMRAHSRAEGSLLITDLRGVDDIPIGNRFLVYKWFPEVNISLRIFDGRKDEFVVVAGGYSILNRTAKADLGSLFAKYGGGGHKASGTCQLNIADADRQIEEIIAHIKANN